MSEYNLQTYLETMRTGINSAYRRNSSPTVPDASLVRLLNMGLKDCQDWLKAYALRDTSVALVAQTQAYTVPSNINGREITAVYVKGETGDEWGLPLKPVSWNDANRTFDLGGGTSTAGSPVYWSYNPANPRQLYLFPKPDYSRTAALAIEYNGLAPMLTRVYLQTTITASVTNGSPNATLSASAASVAYNITATDAFGICLTTNFDATAVTQSNSPDRWYEISSFNGTTGIVLTESFGEGTASAKVFMVAQVSALERANPGKMGMAPAWLGLSKHLMLTGKRDEAREWKAMAEEQLGRAALFTPGLMSANMSMVGVFGEEFMPGSARGGVW